MNFWLKIRTLFMLAMGLLVSEGQSATFNVLNNADSGPGSLRDVVGQANATPGSNTIVFAPGLAGSTVILTSGQLIVTNHLTILGPPTNQVAISGNRNNRIFYFTRDMTNVIANLILTNGNAQTENGGAILNDHSFLTLSNVTLSGNTAHRGGAIFNEGIFPGRAVLIIQDSTITANSSANLAGAIYIRGPASPGTLLLIQNSTLSGNSSATVAGAIYSNEATTIIRNSTLSGNSAVSGGAIETQVTITGGSSPLTIQNCTISGGSARGYSINNVGATLTIGNTIMARGATAGNYTSFFAGTVINQGHNMSDDISTTGFATQVVNVGIGPLASNGGPTKTHALLQTSPAINAGHTNFNPNAFLPPLVNDQRGNGFPRIQGGRLDIGALESPFTFTVASVTSSPTPSAFGELVTFTATVNPTPLSSNIPTGTVVFYIDGIPSSALTLDATGQAQLTRNNLSVGTHGFSVVYAGGGSFLSSTSAPLSHIVIPVSTTTTITSSGNPTIPGQPITLTFTVVVAAGGFVPTGTVTITIDGTNVGILPLVNGQANLTTSSLAVGTHPVTAIYSGANGFNPSSGTASQTVLSLTDPQVLNVGAVDRSSARFSQTGLMQQLITINNVTPGSFAAIRLNIGLSPAEKAAGIRVHNASGTNAAGNPFVQHNLAVPPGSNLTFTVEYYVPNRRTVPDPVFTVELVEPANSPLPEGTPQALLRTMVIPPDNAVLLDFSTTIAAQYYILYSSNMVDWNAAQPSVKGKGTIVQWVDSGPPKTLAHPNAQTQRYYQVIKTTE